ncbi:uncharacterized protein LOC135494897 [Lineus longissimus]|uniref:uncharacterized protein LOC135494897 n=1 Tax=Lineus longissimus TaxID=88925 RepID=UPI00315CC5B1
MAVPQAMDKGKVGECTELLRKVFHYQGGRKRVARDGRNPSGWFRYPVNPDDVPGYCEEIDQPMDFTTIQEKLNGNQYNNLDEFNADMLLVRDNCTKFNRDEGSQIRMDSNIVFDSYCKEFEKLKNKKKKTQEGKHSSWNVGQHMCAQKEARLDMAHSSAMKVVQKQVVQLENTIL